MDFATAILNFLGSWAGISLMCATALWYAHHSGKVKERVACRAGIIASENAELKRRLEATEKVAETNRAAADEIEQARSALAERVKVYEEELGDPGACIVSNHVRDRVQQIRQAK